jgi:Rad3-related DNA helicase
MLLFNMCFFSLSASIGLVRHHSATFGLVRLHMYSFGRYNGKMHCYEQYPITTVLQMVGRACRPLEDDHSVAVLMCVQHQKTFYTKLLNDCLPLEVRTRDYIS